MRALKLISSNSYKTGVDEVVGLKPAIVKVMQPLLDHLNEQQSWGDRDWFKLEDAEYKSRDGFMAHSDNLGGAIVAAIIPECGQLDFPMCSFPEFEWDKALSDEDNEANRESESGEGYLDSYIRIFLKLESVDLKTGKMTWYLNASTCGEAPYFRLKYSTDLFESEFKCNGIADFKLKATKHIKRLIKKLS